MRLVCVLKCGGSYGPKHVLRLMAQWAAHAPDGVDFHCLTDHPELREATFAIPLEHGWPGWWSKLEMFKVSGPCLYMDLDVNVIGDLTPLLQLIGYNAGVSSPDATRETLRYPLVTCANFWIEDPHTINSSVLAWSGDAGFLYETFARHPKAFMRAYSKRDRWGDQTFIFDHWYSTMKYWQNLLPGMVVSFKRGALKGEDLSNCRVLVSHGEPKPWDSGGADEWLARRARVRV